MSRHAVSGLTIAGGLLVGLLLPQRVSAQEPAPVPEELRELIQALSSEDFQQREQATRRLLALGDAAREALREARASLPLEARLRASAILARLSAPRRKVRDPLRPRPVSLALRGRPLAEVAARLGEAAGCVVRLGGPVVRPGQPGEPDAGLARRPVDLVVDGWPFFKALDELCVRHTLDFVRDYRTGEVILNRTARAGRGPVVYEGPLRVGLTSFSINRTTRFTTPPVTYARLQVRVDVEDGVPVVGLLTPAVGAAARDDRGRELRAPDRGSNRHLMWIDQRRQTYLSVDLDPPSRDALKLDTLTIPLDVVVAEEMLETELVDLGGALGSEPGQGPLQVRLDALTENDQGVCVTVSFVAAAADGEVSLPTRPKLDEIVLFDEQGRPVRPTRRTRRVAAGREIRTFQLPPTRLRSIRVRAMVRYRVETVPVTFSDLPLP